MPRLQRAVCALLCLLSLPGSGCRPGPEDAPGSPAPEAASQAAAPGSQPPGKWRRARGTAPGPVADTEAAARLQATPYLQGYRPAEDRPTVSRYEPAAAWNGLNLFVSGHAAEAVLMDMEGEVLHRWRYPLRRLWPDLAIDPTMAKLEYWRRAHLYPNGDLLAIYEGLGLVKLDARSNVLWARRGGMHHDLEVGPGGEVYVLDREGKVIPRINPQQGVLEDKVTVLEADGRTRRQISLLASLERSPYAALLERMPRAGDIFHTNTLELLDGRFAGVHPAFARGNLLVSILNIDTIAVVDPEREEVVWARTGEWRKQHQPTFVPDGNLLLFDNVGAGQGRSRVLEIEPLTGRVAWRFGGEPEVDLFSKTLGSCQRLPNGNTLVTESENGRALEVTRDGRVVWEFYSPHRAGERQELVAALFEMVRLAPDFPFRGLPDQGSFQ